MITDTLTRLFTSRPVKLLLALVVGLVIASQAAPQLIDTKPYINRLSAEIRTLSGATLLVKGHSEIQILPHVALVLHGVEISQPNVAHSPSVTADIAEFGVNVLSLFSSQPHIDLVRVGGLSVVAERQETGAAEWGFLGMPLLKSLSALKSDQTVRVELFSGRGTIADPKTGETSGFTDLNAAGAFGANAHITGTLTYRDMPLQFSATREGVIGATPIAMGIDSPGVGSLSLKGSMDFTADQPVITAKLDLAAVDISSLITPQTGEIQPQTSEQPTVADPIPLKLSADYLQKQGTIFLNQMTVEALNSKATGSFNIATTPKEPERLSLNFSVLDAADAKRLFTLYKKNLALDTTERGPRTLVNKALNVLLTVAADKIQNGTQSWGSATFDGAVADGVLTVNKLNLALPGESGLTLFGLLSVSDTQGLRFEGNTEAQGKSLRDLLTIFDESASNLPSLGFGAYQFRSNLFVSSELMRLSEADAHFSELSLKGGLVAYFDKKPRIEADLGLRDIDFDYFRNSWRATTDHNDAGSMFLRFDRTMNFDWLKKLGASIDFKVDVQGFNFLERKGKNASFRLFAQTNELGIYNAKFNYGDDVTEANFKFDVSGTQPSLNLVLNTKELNTNYFALTPVPPAPPVPVVPEETAPSKTGEALPDMLMPDSTPEEELRQKIAEEAATLPAPAEAKVTITDPEKPQAASPSATAIPAPTAAPVAPVTTTEPLPAMAPPPPSPAEQAAPVELTPLVKPAEQTIITTTPQSLIISSAEAQEAVVPPPLAGGRQWSEELIDMSFMEGINGSFDISIGTLTHEDKIFRSFKMLAKLERNLLTFQTLTFMHWGGSFSVNGTLFGGKVPGLSLGFIIASADLQQVLLNTFDIGSINGRASLSGTLDTSGVNMRSWIEQASAKLLFAGRGVSIRGFDVASVLTAVSASRTAADVFNNVNLSLVGGAGDYSADGSLNMQKGVISSPGIALKTGKVVGNVSGDFRLIPWDINLTGVFRFPELSIENVPTMTVQWSGPVENPKLQTDTQSLEAFVSKRITGN